MAEGLAETQRDEETLVGAQEEAQRTSHPGPAGRWLRAAVGCVGGWEAAPSSPFLLCLGEVISLHGHPASEENFPSKVEIIRDLGTFQGPVATGASASRDAETPQVVVSTTCMWLAAAASLNGSLIRMGRLCCRKMTPVLPGP